MKPIIRSDGDTVVCTIPAMRLISRTNTHRSWKQDFRATLNHRTVAGTALRAIALRPEWAGAAAIRVSMLYVGPRKMDQGNIAAAFKNVQDGVADAFRVDDGRDEFWTWEYRCAVLPTGKKEPYVQVTLQRRSVQMDWREIGASPGRRAFLGFAGPVTLELSQKRNAWTIDVDVNLPVTIDASVGPDDGNIRRATDEQCEQAKRAAADAIQAALRQLAWQIGRKP